MTKMVPLGRTGLCALVDDDDFERVVAAGPWSPMRRAHTTYARSSRSGPIVWMHALILGGGRNLDHANRNGLDNRRCNLRHATPEQQQANRGPQRNGRTQFRGIYPCGDGWRAKIVVSGKRYDLGRWRTQEGAARAYDMAGRELVGEFAWQNFPGEQLAPEGFVPRKRGVNQRLRQRLPRFCVDCSVQFPDNRYRKRCHPCLRRHKLAQLKAWVAKRGAA